MSDTILVRGASLYGDRTADLLVASWRRAVA